MGPWARGTACPVPQSRDGQGCWGARGEGRAQAGVSTGGRVSVWGGDPEAGPLFLRARPRPAAERGGLWPAAGRPAPGRRGAVPGPRGQCAHLAAERPGAGQVPPLTPSPRPRPVLCVRVAALTPLHCKTFSKSKKTCSRSHYLQIATLSVLVCRKKAGRMDRWLSKDGRGVDREWTMGGWMESGR